MATILEERASVLASAASRIRETRDDLRIAAMHLLQSGLVVRAQLDGAIIEVRAELEKAEAEERAAEMDSG